jgi:hypothetical protein
VADRVFMGARYRTTVLVGDQLIIVESAREDYAPPAGTPVQVGWDEGIPVLMHTTD